jgi:hypothetical protein
MFKEVPHYYQPETPEVFETEFLQDRVLINDWVGSLFDQNIFDGQTSLNHSQITIWMASYGMDLMTASSYRFWTHDDYKDAIKWQRLIWRFIHVYPLGFLISRYSFKKNDLSAAWNPGYESLKNYAQGSRVSMESSNRHISGANISQAIYFKIFGDVDSFDENGTVMMALLDAFSDSPDADNPIFVTFRRVIKKTLYNIQYPIPYFWHDALAFLFTSIPTESIAMQALLNSLKNANVDSAKHKNHQSNDQLPADNDNRDASSNNTVETKTPISAKQTSTSQPVLNEVISDPKTLAVKSPVTTEPGNSDINSVNIKGIQEVLSIIAKGIKENHFKVNKHGALIHKIRGHIFFSHPIWIKAALKSEYENNITNVDIKRLINDFIQNDNIRLFDGAIKSNDDTPNKTINLAQLEPSLWGHLELDVQNMQNNDEIEITGKK